MSNSSSKLDSSAPSHLNPTTGTTMEEGKQTQPLVTPCLEGIGRSECGSDTELCSQYLEPKLTDCQQGKHLSFPSHCFQHGLIRLTEQLKSMWITSPKKIKAWCNLT